MDKFLTTVIGQVGVGGGVAIGFAWVVLQIVKEFRKNQPAPMLKCPVADRFDEFLTDWSKQKYQSNHLADVLEDLRDHLKEQTKALQAIATESTLSAQTMRGIAEDIRDLRS